MATLGEICRAALQEIGGFEVPAFFGGNNNRSAVRSVALLNREGKTLEREFRWAELITTHTFTTNNGIAAYDLPEDFRAFANMSQWDRTNSRPLVGPAAPFVWQWLKGDVTAGNTIDRWFRIQGQRLYIHPTPDVDGDTIAYDYYSKYWVTDKDGNDASSCSNDNDTPKLDGELLTLGLKWRFLQANGMPFEAEYKEYDAMKSETLADNGGKGAIRLGPSRRVWTNLPDRGVGQ
jgi:hypothetical protein